MKVHELISKLKELPQDFDAVICDDENQGYWIIDCVSSLKVREVLHTGKSKSLVIIDSFKTGELL